MQAGLGEIHHTPSQLNIQVYIANRPPMAPYDEQEDCVPMINGEIQAIAQHTGNHWRKVFNVYAKFMFECIQGMSKAAANLPGVQHYLKGFDAFTSWQDYRDACLLQQDSATALLFTPPCFESNSIDQHDQTIHIIIGKGYAQQCGFEYEPPFLLEHHHGDFAVYPKKRVILCPYFDYRQLSNEKIAVLVDIILSMLETDVLLNA